MSSVAINDTHHARRVIWLVTVRFKTRNAPRKIRHSLRSNAHASAAQKRLSHSADLICSQLRAVTRFTLPACVLAATDIWRVRKCRLMPTLQGKRVGCHAGVNQTHPAPLGGSTSPTEQQGGLWKTI
jgi:hypothetical protein